MVTWCYCQGQGRLDGAICEYNEEDKMSFLREVPPYLHISIDISASTSTHYLRISLGGGCRGEEHGDGGTGVRGADPHGGGQVSRGVRHPARQAQGGPGGQRERQHLL